MTHLNSEDLIDAIEGALPEERQAHLAACAACRAELAGLSSVLADAKQLSVPEPSPLFWPHFSQRVRTAIADDSAPASNWPSWLRWRVVLPLGAVTIIILGLMIAVPRQDLPETTVALEPPPASEPMDSWMMVANLVGDLDVETATAAGVIGPGVADQAVLQLTGEEQLELTRLLKAELTRAKS